MRMLLKYVLGVRTYPDYTFTRLFVTKPDLVYQDSRVYYASAGPLAEVWKIV